MGGTQKKIDPIRQDILRHLDAHNIAIKLIKDSIQFLDITEGNNKRVDLFKLCLEFLRNFVMNNPINQL